VMKGAGYPAPFITENLLPPRGLWIIHSCA
jgi:hypothetical protein